MLTQEERIKKGVITKQKIRFITVINLNKIFGSIKMEILKNVISIVVVASCLNTTLAFAGNKVEILKKPGGSTISHPDGSGPLYIGCKEANCSYIVGKYSHPHNIQEHKKTFIKLNSNGGGSYALWSRIGDELYCKGKLSKWGLLYNKKGKLFDKRTFILVAKKKSSNPECALKNGIIEYTDFIANSKGSQFYYFLKE